MGLNTESIEGQSDYEAWLNSDIPGTVDTMGVDIGMPRAGDASCRVSEGAATTYNIIYDKYLFWGLVFPLETK